MLDEYDVIRLITSRFGKLPKGYTPIGDDVALIPHGRRGEEVVLKADMLVAKTDVPPGMSWRQASRKAVAMCVSDFGAKGARPGSFMVSLGLPRGTEEAKVVELASGFLDASREWKVKLVGGDTGEADDLVISCMMVGFAKSIVRRGGARPGQLIVTSGPFGQTAAGLKIMTDGATADASFRKTAVSSVCTPTPPLEVGVAVSKHLSSSIDSSDGLAISLHTIAEMSGVGMRLGDELPFVKGLERFASRNSYSAEELALYGGEEYQLVGTIDRQRLKEAQAEAKSAGGELRVIGETNAGKGVLFADGRTVRRDGWVHFKSEP